MKIEARIGDMLDNVFQKEQVHIMPFSPHQRSEFEEGFFSTTAPEVGNNQGDFQIRGNQFDGGSV
jgi:hypothetical protein